MPYLPEPEWDWDDDPITPDVPSVDLTPRSVTNVLWGPNDEILAVMLDRPPVTGFAAWLYDRIGYQPTEATWE